MASNYGQKTGADNMGNNRLANKAVDRAAKEANLNQDERIQLSKDIHALKNYDTGDKDYSTLLEMAKEIKNKK